MPMLSDELKISAEHVLLQKYLKALSRERLVALATEWSQADNVFPCSPDLDPDATTSSLNFQAASPTLEAVREVYGSLLADKANKQEVIERMCSVDWKAGFSLWQLAQVERSLLDQKAEWLTWTAFKIRRASIKFDAIYQQYATPVHSRQIKITADQLAKGLEEELGFLLNMHSFISHDHSTGLALLRITIVGNHDILDKSRLHATDGGSLTLGSFWIALPSDGMEIFHSAIPSQILIAQDKGTLLVDAIAHVLSSLEDRVFLETVGDTERSLARIYKKTQRWSLEESKEST